MLARIRQSRFTAIGFRLPGLAFVRRPEAVRPKGIAAIRERLLARSRGRTTRRRPARVMRPPVLAVAPVAALALVGVGAGLMYLFDPRLGRRRRALLRDKAAKALHLTTRRMPERIEHRARYMAGRLHGIEHEAVHQVESLLHPSGPEADNVTLAQRVRSEIFAPADIPDGAINVDAYEGIVTLRGQLPTREMIDRVVRMAQRVEGVRDVRCLLHTPGTPVPAH